MKKIISLSFLFLSSMNCSASFFEDVALPLVGVGILMAQAIAGAKIDHNGVPITPLNVSLIMGTSTILCTYPFTSSIIMDVKWKAGTVLVGSAMIAGHLLYRYNNRIPFVDEYRARA